MPLQTMENKAAERFQFWRCDFFYDLFAGRCENQVLVCRELNRTEIIQLNDRIRALLLALYYLPCLVSDTKLEPILTNVEEEVFQFLKQLKQNSPRQFQALYYATKAGESQIVTDRIWITCPVFHADHPLSDPVQSQ